MHMVVTARILFKDQKHNERTVSDSDTTKKPWSAAL